MRKYLSSILLDVDLLVANQIDALQALKAGGLAAYQAIIERLAPSPAYKGRLKILYTYTGLWEIKGDSLYRYFDGGIDYKIDRSSITYPPEKRDTVEQILKQFEENAVTTIEQKKKQDRDTIVRAVAIDRSGNKVELTFPENDQNGRVSYLIREKATEKP